MADQIISDRDNQSSKTTSPGGRAVSPGDREGFANHPHFAEDTTAGVDRRDISANASEEFGTGSIGASRGANMGTSGAGIMDRMRSIPTASRDLVSRVDAHARANPWMHVGIMGFGGLLLGYLVGRSFGRQDDSSTSFTAGMSAGDTYMAYDE